MSMTFLKMMSSAIYSNLQYTCTTPAGIYLLTLTIEALKQGVQYVQS